MATQADFTVYDGEVTPVAHIFVADHVEYDGKALTAIYSEKKANIPEYAQVNAVLKKMPVKGGMTRVGYRVNVPVMEALASNSGNSSGYVAQPKVAYVDSTEIVQWVHTRSLSQGRLNSIMMALNFVRNLATTQTPISSGVFYDAFVRLVFPS